jgi:hypothetical protein
MIFSSPNLLNHNINLVPILHVEVFRGLSFVETLTIEEEANVVSAELNGDSGTLCRWQ